MALAHAAYCRAFFWDRNNVDRHINLATVCLVRRDWKKAAQFGQSALKLDPKNRKALGIFGDALAALNQTREARAAWLQADDKSEANARQLRVIVKRNLALADRVARLNDFALAERLYRRALLIEPEQTDAVKGIASCLLKAGETEAAAVWAHRAEQLKRSG